MLKLRFSGYELERIDQYNIGIFKVADGPVKEKRGGVRNRKSDDGKTLVHLGKYYGSYGAAARALHEMLLSQHIEDPELASVADAIEAAREDFRAASERIDAIGRECGAPAA